MRTERANGGGQADRRDLKVIVGAAIIRDGRVLACARSAPPEVAGMWEFPGGKVEPGESETDALVRECAEELAVRVEIGDRVGRDVRMAHGRSVLKVYAARLLHGDAAAARWSTPRCAGWPPTSWTASPGCPPTPRSCAALRPLPRSEPTSV